MGGLAGGAGLSQFPEFSQQYLQRLAGTVDEIQLQVSAFDASARRAGLTREEALAETSESAFLNSRQNDARAMINRSERLTADLDALRASGPILRVFQAPRLTDPEIAASTWSDFKPAAPLTLEGLVCALLGVFAGAALVGFVARALWWPVRRLRAKA